MNPVRLTFEEWMAVAAQCCECRHWHNERGCEYPFALDAFPVKNCNMYPEREDPRRACQD